MFFSAPAKILCAQESPKRKKKQEHKYAYKKDQDDITRYPPYDISLEKGAKGESVMSSQNWRIS
jgi:hypothetical protein